MSKKKAVKQSNLVKRPSTIVRRSAPHEYDHAPQGTQCIVDNKELYIQTCADENSPCWVLQGPYDPTPLAQEEK
jgi:hypothetical protein